MPHRFAAALTALLALLLPPTPAVADEHESRECVPDHPDGYRRVVDLTFPVAGPVAPADFPDTYDAARSGGRTHQASDIMVPKLRRVHAALGGVVEWVTGVDEPVPSYGYMIRLRHGDGLTTSYVHLNNDTPGSDDGQGGPEWAYAPGIRDGVTVERGQWIGYVGDSGNAESTAAHLHFELRDEALDDPCLDGTTDPKRLDPRPSLLDAYERGDVPAPPAASSVERVAGSTRVLTSVAISRRREPGTRAVIVVPEGSHAEALVAAPLAGLLDAPILLSGAAGLHDDVATEMQRLGARNAYVIGTVEQLSSQIESDLRAAGVTDLARIAEPDPFALSARIAREIRSYDEAPALERVFLALGSHDDPKRAWPDALSAAALAALTKAPVLLTPPDTLPAAVRDVLAELRPPLLQVVGGPGAVAEELAVEAARAAGAERERLAGDNRFATSAAVADEAVALGLSAPGVWFATGHAFPDALAAGPAAAREGVPLLLVDGSTPGGAPEPDAWLADRAAELDSAVVVGGIAAITEPVRDHLASLMGG